MGLYAMNFHETYSACRLSASRDFLGPLAQNLRLQRRFGCWFCPWILLVCIPLYAIDRDRKLDQLYHTSWTYSDGAPGEVHSL